MGDILLIAPITSYLVMDGFEKDFNAALIFKWLIALSYNTDMIKHVNNLLWSALTGTFHASDKKLLFWWAVGCCWYPLQPKHGEKIEFLSFFCPSSTPPQQQRTTPINTSMTTPYPTNKFPLQLMWQLQPKPTNQVIPQLSQQEDEYPKSSTFENSILKKLCRQREYW